MVFKFDLGSYPGEAAKFDCMNHSKRFPNNFFSHEWHFTTRNKKAFIQTFTLLKTYANTYYMFIHFKYSDPKEFESYFKKHHISMNFNHKNKMGTLNQIEEIKKIFNLIKAANEFNDNCEKEVESVLDNATPVPKL